MSARLGGLLALALLLPFTGILVHPAEAQLATQTFTENFEAPPAGNVPPFTTPQESWYSISSGTGSIYADTTQAASGTQSLDIKSGTPSPTFVFGAPHPCDSLYDNTGTPSREPITVSVKVRLAALPPSGSFLRFGLTGSLPGNVWTTNQFYFQIESDGAVSATIYWSQYSTFGGADNFNSAHLRAGIWYTFSILNARCDQPNPTGQVDPQGNPTYNHRSCATFTVTALNVSLAAPVCNGITGPISGSFFFQGNPSDYDAHNQYWIDDFTLTTALPPVVPLTNTSAANLVGFSVDPFDQSAIARLNTPGGGQDVVSLDPYDLHVSGRFHEATCNRLGGVTTRYSQGKVFLSFLDCDPHNTVNVLRVRNQNLGPPDWTGTPCAGETFCDQNITGPFLASGDSAPPQDARDLGRIEAAPWDYTLGSTEPSCLLCVKHVTLSWAFDEISGGHVGAYALTMNKNAQDAAATSAQVYAPQGTVINDFCAWRDTTTRQDYIAAIRNDGPTKIYRVTVTEQLASGAVYHVPDVTTTTIYNGGGAFDSAVAIGCARDRILVVTNDGRAVLATVLGQVLHTFPAPTPLMHGAAMSLDGAHGVIGTAGAYHLLDLVNDTNVLQETVPAGQLYATSLDFNAKVLWSATSAGPFRFDVARSLGTQSVPLGANRDLATGAVVACTDLSGSRSSYCTGVADPPTTTGGGTGTSTGTGTDTSTSGSTTTTSGSTSTSGGSTSTGGVSNTTTTPGNSTGGGGGGGAVAPPAGLNPLAVAGALVAVLAAVAVAARRRFT